MPRLADPKIGTEILDAATRLLDKDSADAVTMRAVSEQTGIAVTTIYERFGDRRGLLHSLALHVAEDEALMLSRWSTIEELFCRYLDFAQVSPHRYKLLADTFFERLESKSGVPGFDWLKTLLARRIGGTPEEHTELALGIVALLVGTVSGIVYAGEDNVGYQARVRNAATSVLTRALASKEKHRK